MMSLRAIARTAPRAAAARFSMVAAPAARRVPGAAAVSAVGRHSAAVFGPMRAAAAFSTSGARATKTDVDSELSEKLQSEIHFEKDVRKDEPESTAVQDFLESGLFEIEDIAGREEVVLRRTHGNEKITVTFSVADLSNYDPDLFEDDAALADEEGNEHGAQKSAQAAEAEEGAEEEDDDLDAGAVPVRLSIVVEKPGKGALNVEATAQDGSLLIDNLYYYKDAAHAHEASPDAAHAAQLVYPGPAFGSLDEDLQVLLDRYLEERGITQSLAVFVPEYLDAKEHREYLGFLENLKTFVDA